MNGIEMIEKMSDDGLLKTIPVIMVSTEGSATRIEHVKSKGVSAYVRKPFTPELIRKVVFEVMGLDTGKDHKKILANALCEVLEKQAFMFGEMTDKEELPGRASGYVRADMTFSGEISGSMALVVPEEMCPEIAANVLGMDQDSEMALERADDSLKEILNVTCGQVLTSLAGETLVFDLSVPETKKLEAQAWNDFLKQEETLGFLVDEKPALMRLIIE